VRTSRIRLADVLRRSDAVHEWTVQLPCTTPTSQQAILQGTAVDTSWPALLTGLVTHEGNSSLGNVPAADALHRHLIAILEPLGHRANLQRSTR